MRLLLDENCSRRLAEMLRREGPAMSLTRIQEWQCGPQVTRDTSVC